MLNLCQKTKRESHPAFFGSSPQPMSFMCLQRLHIQIVEVYRQKFLRYTGEAASQLGNHKDIYLPPAHACNVFCAHRTISVDSEAATHRTMREALEVLRAALHPSMAHRSGAHRLWPSAPPRGAGVAGGDLSAVSGLHPRENRAVAAAPPPGHRA